MSCVCRKFNSARNWSAQGVPLAAGKQLSVGNSPFRGESLTPFPAPKQLPVSRIYFPVPGIKFPALFFREFGCKPFRSLPYLTPLEADSAQIRKNSLLIPCLTGNLVEASSLKTASSTTQSHIFGGWFTRRFILPTYQKLMGSLRPLVWHGERV